MQCLDPICAHFLAISSRFRQKNLHACRQGLFYVVSVSHSRSDSCGEGTRTICPAPMTPRDLTSAAWQRAEPLKQRKCREAPSVRIQRIELTMFGYVQQRGVEEEKQVNREGMDGLRSDAPGKPRLFADWTSVVHMYIGTLCMWLGTCLGR